jgi:hypothetical protein
MRMIDGQCLCGVVRFRLTGKARAPVACHCSQGRRISGHDWAATQVSDGGLEVLQGVGLIGFRSSDTHGR